MDWETLWLYKRENEQKWLQFYKSSVTFTMVEFKGRQEEVLELHREDIEAKLEIHCFTSDRNGQTNLKDGIGDPWAGQGRLKAFAKLAEKPEIVFAEGNLGAEPPTGSEKDTKLEKSKKPKGWNGRPLCRT